MFDWFSSLSVIFCYIGETFKWIKGGCSNYTFHGNSPPLLWEQSRVLCKKTGLGDLVSIESKKEWTFLKNTILNLTMADEYFIGLRKDGRSGQWGWLSNKNTSQTGLPCAKWEPSGDGTRATMYKDYRRGYGKYNDLGCTTKAKPSLGIFASFLSMVAIKRVSLVHSIHTLKRLFLTFFSCPEQTSV